MDFKLFIQQTGAYLKLPGADQQLLFLWGYPNSSHMSLQNSIY
jgi:hypothetical protein